MVFYGLAILSGTVLMNFFAKHKEVRGKGFLLFITVLLVFLGILQRKNSPIEIHMLRFLTQLITAVYDLAPYVLGLFSVAIIYRSYYRLKRRGWSRKYVFLLFMSTNLFVLLLVILANHLWWRESFLYTLEFLLGVAFLYVVATFLGFIFLAYLYRFIRPGLEKEFLIVLGAGLLPNGTIRSLLRYRLDEALLFHQKQKNMGIPLSKIIVSGGKGLDEPFSEEAAMREYLLQHGVSDEQIFVEDQSLNTHQNFLYSKNMIDEMKKNEKIIFITNNFHVLRSGVYARRAGVEAEGVGARTPIHYLPYALVREYLAVMFIYRTFHSYMLAILLIFILMFFK